MPVPDRLAERVGRCLAGLVLFGLGITLIIRADLGLAPWDVFHQGLSELTGIGIGTIIVAIGFALLLLWIPLRVRPGIGTVLNALAIGITVDLLLPHLAEPERLVWRVLLLAGALLTIAVGSGLYIGAGLGPGPRDGLMIGLEQRGWSIRLARTVIEIVVLVAGVALGGSVGVGTAAFAFGIGPVVQIFLPLLRMTGQPVGDTDPTALLGE